MNQEKILYSVTRVEEITGIPNATIRRYLRNHGSHLIFAKRGKNYLISNESLPIIRKIRELYDSGKQSEDVEETLQSMNMPMTVTVNENGNEVTVNASQVLTELHKIMKDQEAFNQSLLKRLDEQQEYIDKKLEERDLTLLQSLKELKEARMEVATSKKKGFFSRFFN